MEKFIGIEKLTSIEDVEFHFKKISWKLQHYFQTNWLPITSQWIEYLKPGKSLYGLRTNNRAESFFSVMKKKIKTKPKN